MGETRYRCNQCGYISIDENIQEKGCQECDECDWEIIE